MRISDWSSDVCSSDLFVIIASIHAAIAWSGHETIWTFSLLQAAMMGCFGLASANFGAMAMEPMGEVAGTAASLQGFISTVGGSLLGFAIGQQFNGTTVPVTIGFAILGVLDRKSNRLNSSH